jgi:hypothetical protein
MEDAESQKSKWRSGDANHHRPDLDKVGISKNMGAWTKSYTHQSPSTAEDTGLPGKVSRKISELI